MALSALQLDVIRSRINEHTNAMIRALDVGGGMMNVSCRIIGHTRPEEMTRSFGQRRSQLPGLLSTGTIIHGSKTCMEGCSSRKCNQIDS